MKVTFQETTITGRVDGDRPYIDCGFLCSRTDMSIVQVTFTAVSDALAEKYGLRDPDPCFLFSKVVTARTIIRSSINRI